MSRKFRQLGSVLLAVVALGGLGAAQAQAEPEFHSEASTTTGTGAQEGTIIFTNRSGTLHCQTVTGEGTMTGATVREVKSFPTFSGCKSTGFIEAQVTVETNGCWTLITAAAKVHLLCPAGKTIQITAPFCTISYGPQSATSVEYTNVGTGTTREIIGHEVGENIHYTQSGFACNGTGTFTDGTAEGTVRVTGENPVTQAHVGISWG